MLEVAPSRLRTRRSSRATRSTCPSRTERSSACSRAISTATSRKPTASASSPRRGACTASSSSSTPPCMTASRGSSGRSASSRTARAGRSTSASSTGAGLLDELGGGDVLFEGRWFVPRPRVTRRRSTYRSLASLQRDNRRCRACAEAGYPLESLPVLEGHAGQRAYIYGQAPGILEGEERRPWRGRAGQTLRRWLELDEESSTRRSTAPRSRAATRAAPPPARGDRVPAPREQELCAFWFEQELRLLRPRADRRGRRARDPPPARPSRTSTMHRPRRSSAAAPPVVPLPHPSGVSRWLNVPANRACLDARARARPRPARESEKAALDLNGDPRAVSVPPHVRPAARLPEAVPGLPRRLDPARGRLAGGADRRSSGSPGG